MDWTVPGTGRYASTGLAVGLLIAMGLAALFALLRMPRVPRASLFCVIFITVLLVRHPLPCSLFLSR